MHGDRTIDKYAKREFEKYPGAYILATQKEIWEQYNDPTKYRFVMDYRIEKTKSTAIQDPNEFPYTGIEKFSTGYRYYIVDRQLDVEYIRNSKSSFFAKEMRAYLEAIDRVRLK